MPEQKQQAERWFKEAEQGKSAIVIGGLVIAEAASVLEYFYHQERAKIASALETFISQPWLEVPERAILLSLWRWYVQGLHFMDSWLLAAAEAEDARVLTFDAEIKAKTKSL